MHYQTVLAPISDEGAFLAAVLFDAAQFGGEDTRETAATAFWTGHIDRLNERKDKLTLCTLPRPASREEEQWHVSMAKGQEGLTRNAKLSKFLREQYSSSAIRMRHSAWLAGRDNLWVPRVLRVSSNGRALLGFDTTGVDVQKGRSATLRLVDTTNNIVLLEERSAIPPRWLAAPKGISVDGSRALFASMQDNGLRTEERLLQPGLPITASFDGGHMTSAALGLAAGWLSFSDGYVSFNAYVDGRLLFRHMLPKQHIAWAANAASGGSLAAIPALGGSVAALDLHDGKLQTFLPHRGARRDTIARVAVSDDGAWIASLADGHLYLTNVAEGVSREIGELRETIRTAEPREGHSVVDLVSPGMAFVGGRLLLAGRDGLQFVLPERMPGEEFASGGSRKRKPAATKKSLVEALAAIPAPGGGSMAAFYSPAVRMKSKPLGKSGWMQPDDVKAPPLGTTRLGGWPDLDNTEAWPLWQDRPMAFLAQVNLAEAHAAQAGLRLPKAGLLSFFLGCGDGTYTKGGDTRERYMVDIMAGTDASDAGAWRVIHTPPGRELGRKTRSTLPLPELFEPCSVVLEAGGLTIPYERTVVYERLSADQAKLGRYNELLQALAASSARADNQLMGYPNLIQFTPPELMCERSFRGEDPWRLPGENDPTYAALADAASEWTLLLQLTSDRHAGFHWGDGGHVYFYAKRDATERGDFSQVWINYEN